MNIFNNLKSFLLKSTLFLLLLNITNIQAQNKQLSQSEIEAKAKVYQHLFSGTSALSKKEINKIKSARKANCGSQQLNTAINGECHNINNADWGKANIPLFREVASEYGASDPLNAFGGTNRANPRSISNAVSKQDSTVFPSATLSSFVFSWGQFIDHDIGISPAGDEVVMIPNTEEQGDLITENIPFRRTIVFDGTGINTPRAQENIITTWIDGSNVYGSDPERQEWLREDSHGKLRTSAGNLLPYNTDNFEVSGDIDEDAPHMDTEGLADKVFVAGDARANEQSSLTALHTLFVREHNRICDELIGTGLNPITQNELIYQRARKRVAALIQHITFNEFLPALGINLPPYTTYDNTVQPDLMNGFSTAAFRLGHTMVPNDLLLLDDDGNQVNQGTVTLPQAFFNPNLIAENGIEPVLKGLSIQFQEEIDARIVEELRTFLFSPDRGFGAGLDLAALNIQRGRDHGLADYNTYRQHFTNTVANSFADITSDLNLQGRLASVYPNINDMDLWVGLLSEDKMPGAEIGPTLHAFLTAQFSRLRNGDYYFYMNDPALSSELGYIQNTLLSDVVRRNTSITNIQDDVFRAECNLIAENCCRLNDSLTLVTLYNQTNGPNWTNSWNLNQPMSTWDGVFLDEQGCVKLLILNNNRLNGNLPPELSDLQSLTYLDLGNNQLSGTIPPNIGNLFKVGYLDLSNNNLTGYIPASLSTMTALTFIYLNDNNLIGGIPVEFGNFPSLGFLYVNNNNLSDCFNTSLRFLCDRLNAVSNNNASISDGNNFPVSWEDFCDGDSGNCDGVVWPGDLNNDGFVNQADPLYWGIAEAFQGPARTNASTNWTAQAAPDWQQNALEVNSKHQDADGNGRIDAVDLQIVDVNFGRSRDNGPTLLSFAPTDLEYIFESLPSNGGNQRYAIYIEDGERLPVTAHGIAFSIGFGNAPINDVNIDVNSSILAPDEVFEIFNADRNILTLALTRTDGVDVLCDGPIAIIGINSNNDMSGETFSINIGVGTVLQTNGEVENIGPMSHSDVYDGFTLNSSTLEISATVMHEQCNQLGKATVHAYNGPMDYYLYEWSTGANTATVENLPSGTYTVKVTDVSGSSKELTVTINGQMPVYDENGNLICASFCADYLNPQGTIPSDSFHADSELNSNGTIQNGSNVEFKAGERISLESGFSIESNTTFKADIEDCE